MARLAWLLLALPALSCACAARYRTEHLGDTSLTARPGTRATEAAPLESRLPIQDAASIHFIDYRLSTPRATALAWRVSCPGFTREGRLGETLEAYRARRVRQLEEERRRQAALVGTVVDAVAPPVQATAAATSPGAHAEATATVAPGEVAEAVAYESNAVALDPRDVGPQWISGRIEIATAAPGDCSFAIWPDPADQPVDGVRVDLHLGKQVDVREEKRARREAFLARATENGSKLRVELEADLVAAGADPEHRAKVELDRRRAEEERLRIAAERRRVEEERRRVEEERRQARLRIEEEKRRARELAEEQREAERIRVEAQLRLEARRREEALRVRQLAIRGQIITYLVSECGGDPHKRDRERAAERERRRREKEARLAGERRRAELRIAEAQRLALIRAQEEARRAELREREEARRAELREREEARRAAIEAARAAEEARRAELALSLRGEIELSLREIAGRDEVEVLVEGPSYEEATVETEVVVAPPQPPPVRVVTPAPPPPPTIVLPVDVEIDIGIGIPQKPSSKSKSPNGVKVRQHGPNKRSK